MRLVPQGFPYEDTQNAPGLSRTGDLRIRSPTLSAPIAGHETHTETSATPDALAGDKSGLEAAPATVKIRSTLPQEVMPSEPLAARASVTPAGWPARNLATVLGRPHPGVET